MPNINLYPAIYADQVDHNELEHVLLSYFGGGRQLNISEFAYGRSESAYALKLRYEDDSLVEIVAGDGWKETDLPALQNKIREELLSPVEHKVRRIVAFTALPTRGAIRYSNVFQILPVPPSAPQPRFQVADHPFLIEFRFPTSRNSGISTDRQSMRAREIELLCNALSAYPVRTTSPLVRQHWVADRLEQGQWISDFKQEMYTWPGATILSDEYSPIDHFPLLPTQTEDEYFQLEGISVGQEYSLPENFSALCKAFFNLPQKERSRFLRACFWYQHAQRVGFYSPSAMFIAFISAIEALMPPPINEGRCQACGRPTGQSSTQRFAEFVEQLGPTQAITEADRKKFYAIRSKLSHGGTLLHRDHSGLTMGFNPAPIKDWATTRTVRIITRIALVTWLARRGP